MAGWKETLSAAWNKLAGLTWTPRTVGVVLAVALVLVLVVWLLIRARRPKVEAPAKPDAPPDTEGKLASLWRRRDRLLDELRYLTTRSEWRYRSPFVLLLGEQGAGKSSLVSTTFRERGGREALLVAEQKLACPGASWRFTSQCVLIDPEGALVAAAPGTPEAAKYDDVLAAIDRRRPERAIDATVLAVSARTLLESTPADLQALAERLYGQLWQVQKRFELVLPVYLVVTRCDEVPGYAAFFGAQAEGRRKEMCGWSNPSAADQDAPADLARYVMRGVTGDLRRLLFQAAGRDQIRDADDYFLFPERLGRLEAPLAAVLAEILKPSTYSAAFLFRGVYFTGSLAAAPPRPEPIDTIDFASALFADKVFAEPFLARPISRRVLSRSRLIRNLQIGAIGATGALTVALIASAVSLHRETSALITAANEVRAVAGAKNVVRDADGERCYRDAVVADVVQKIVPIRNHLRYAAIPISLVHDGVFNELANWIARSGFEEVVFPAMACRLERSARAIAAADLTTPGAGGDIPSVAVEKARARFKDHLDAVLALEENLDAFHHLQSRRGRDHMAEDCRLYDRLSNRLFTPPLPAAPANLDRSVFGVALVAADYAPSLSLPPGLDKTTAEQIRTLAGRLHRTILAEAASGERSVKKLEALERGESPGAAVTFFRDWIDWIRAGGWLDAEPGNSLCDTIGTTLDDAAARLARLHPGYPGDLGRDDFTVERCERPVRASARGVVFPGGGPVFTETSGVIDLDSAVKLEVAGFVALEKLPFMQARHQGDWSCRPASAGWSDVLVGQAMGYLHEYQLFAKAMRLDTAPSRPLYDEVGRRQLEFALEGVLTAAQLPVRPGAGPDSDTLIAERSAAFAHQQDTLGTLPRELRALQLERLATPLDQCLRAYAGDVLCRIDAAAESSRLYDPPPGAGEGEGALVYRLGDEAQIKDYLIHQRDRAGVLAGWADPFVKYLDASHAESGATRAAASPAYWRNTQQELKQYKEGKDPDCALANLETFFTKTLGPLAYDECVLLSQSVTAGPGLDLFSARHRALEDQSQLRCQDRREADAYTQYGLVANRFNRDLAGRFPFGDADARDADIAVVADFFRDYAAVRAPLAKAMTVLKASRWSEVRHFVDQLNKAADFLGPTLGAEGGVRAVRLRAGFRAFRTDERGAEQLIRWRLFSGLSTLDYPGGGEIIPWTFDDAIALDLIWATQSQVRPHADDAQNDLRIYGATARFGEGAPWSLLRLLGAHRPRTAPLVDPTDRARALLEFRVPVDDAQKHAGEARVFLSLGTSVVDPKTQAETQILPPREWPVAAPTGN